jgi:hypothetical protein
MRRNWIFLALILAFLLACRGSTHLQEAASPAGPAPTSGSEATLPPSATPPPPSPTPTPTRTPPPTLTPTATLPPPTGTPAGREGFSLDFHPDGGLYAGDQVSLEVIAPPGSNLKGKSVLVEVNGPGETTLGPEQFGRFGIGGRYQATFWWAWDTRGLEAGDYSLTFSIQPEGAVWTETVSLLPQEELPAPEPEGRWGTSETDCCLVYYITGTQAERDLELLEEMLDEQARKAAERLETEFEEPVQVFFVPRVLGHGGFASQEIAVSYLDRNYAGNDPALVLHHEMVHILDGRLGGELRPSFLVEGLAVYLSGGHFKPEALLPRAAALLDLGGYVPLSTLVKDFYPVQHETGYLEGAALIEYMVDTWGWEAFSNFYRDIHPLENQDDSLAALNAALEEHFGLNLEGLEEGFLAVLRAYPLTPELREDVRLTIEFYETVRRYQQLLDPSAYFLSAWLPPTEEMRERGIVADFVRHPETPANIAVETLLVGADAHLREANYEAVSELLSAANGVLERVADDQADPFGASPLAADTFAIVQALLAQGYEPHRIEVLGDAARVWASRAEGRLFELDVNRSQDGWLLRVDAYKPARPSFAGWASRLADEGLAQMYDWRLDWWQEPARQLARLITGRQLQTGYRTAG